MNEHISLVSGKDQSELGVYEPQEFDDELSHACWMPRFSDGFILHTNFNTLHDPGRV